MERTRFIQHRGCQVVLVDFTNLDRASAIAEIEKSKRFYAARPAEGNLLTCTDTSGTTYDGEILDALKQLAAHNRPYVRAASVVLESTLKRTAVSVVAMFSRRKLQGFATRDEALDWLVEQ